jgi:hypothetical protein
VGLRPTAETKESLRITLEKVQECFDSPESDPAMVELKHIILQRIADLDAMEAHAPAEADVAPSSRMNPDSAIPVLASDFGISAPSILHRSTR